jgi:hypothetical protein
MRELRSWFQVIFFFFRYVGYRLRIAKRPTFEQNFQPPMDVIGRILGWRKYLHVRGGEHLPLDHPAIICGNHFKLDDPFCLFASVYLASNGTVSPRALQRDDFFKSVWWKPVKNRFLDVDECITGYGTYGINRSNPTLKQLKVFLGFLDEGLSFMMYPGRTRSRSGVFMEFRGEIKEPGGVSFFLHQTQRRNPGANVSAVPVARSYNLVTNRTAMVIGPERRLAPNADKEEQRAFDLDLVVAMAGQVELNVAHVVGAILYLRCLHGRTEKISNEALRAAVGAVFEKTTHPYIDPQDLEDLGESIDRTLSYLERRGMVRRRGDAVTPDEVAILGVPPLDRTYVKRNPVKYLTNQIMHLGDVVELVEEAAQF